MSRKEKFSRSAKRRHQAAEPNEYFAEEADISVSKLPSRRKKHPSSKIKLTKIYYNILFVLFVALVVFLFWFGIKYTESQ